MSRCLQLAQLGAGNVAPNPMVGAVLVHQDRIIGEGYHRQYGQPHAEVNCLNSVAAENKSLIPFSTIYVSLEPCAHFGKTPPCAELIIKNKIPKVIVGCRDHFEQVNGKGIEKLRAAGIEVEMSRMEKECEMLNRRFFTFHRRHRPYIILKWAQATNGFIGNKSGKERLLISNDITNRLVHRWRSEEAAILIGTNTALADNPSLTNRLWKGKNPIRMVIDRKNILPESLAIFDGQAETIVFSEVPKPSFGKNTFTVVDKNKSILPQILDYSYTHNIQSILVEGGRQLLQSFIHEKLWDEMRIITNTQLYISNGIAAPELTDNCIVSHQEQIENDRIDFIFNPINH